MDQEKREAGDFTYDLLNRSSQSEEQMARREIRRKKLEKKTKVRDPEKKKQAAKRRRAIFAVFIVAAFVSALAVRAWLHMNALNRERAQTQARLEALEAQKEALENELLLVNSDEYVEQQARNQLHMIKPGEILYIVPAPVEGTEEPSSEEAPGGAKP